MFSLMSLGVFSLRRCSYYLYTPVLCSCLGCCSLSEITHWVHVPETGVSFVAWYPRYNTSPAGDHSGVVSENLRLLMERGCDRKDAVILIIPIMTQTPRQAPQSIEVCFSPEICRKMTRWNVSDSHLAQRELVWIKQSSVTRLRYSMRWALWESALWVPGRHWWSGAITKNTF